jgi:hypothetical protein
MSVLKTFAIAGSTLIGVGAGYYLNKLRDIQPSGWSHPTRNPKEKSAVKKSDSKKALAPTVK